MNEDQAMYVTKNIVQKKSMESKKNQSVDYGILNENEKKN